MPAITCSLPSVPISIVGLRSGARAQSLCRYLPQIRRHLRLSSSQVFCLIKADTSAPIEWHEERLKHVVESQQFSQAALAKVFATATEMEAVKRGTPDARQLEGYIMSTLFYEPSTRTRLSFESAMSRLGGTVLSTESAGEYSSAAKGETLEGDLQTAIAEPFCKASLSIHLSLNDNADTIRTIEGYADCIVLRHNLAGSAKRAAAAASVPIINAGDGPGQHPTQVLLKPSAIYFLLTVYLKELTSAISACHASLPLFEGLDV